MKFTHKATINRELGEVKQETTESNFDSVDLDTLVIPSGDSNNDGVEDSLIIADYPCIIKYDKNSPQLVGEYTELIKKGDIIDNQFRVIVKPTLHKNKYTICFLEWLEND